MGVSRQLSANSCGSVALLAILYSLLFVLILRDALWLSSHSESSVLASAWTGVSLIVLLVCVYLSMFNQPIILTLFAFFSGAVAGKARDVHANQRDRVARASNRVATKFSASSALTTGTNVTPPNGLGSA